MAHACHPSYSGGRDQEDHGSKPALAYSSQDLISKKPSQKRFGGVAQGIGPEFKSQYCKKNVCVYIYISVIRYVRVKIKLKIIK
jgi:hypothetical protein